jgi:hypothetical protein
MRNFLSRLWCAGDTADHGFRGGTIGAAQIRRSEFGMSGMTRSADNDVRILFPIKAYKDSGGSRWPRNPQFPL